MHVRWKTEADDAWLRRFLEARWGGTSMIVRGETIDMLPLPALIAGERDGIAVIRDGDPAELVVLEAVVQSAGVGSALLAALVRDLCERGIRTLRVTTTNDNLAALRFYQKRGFRLRALRPGAIDDARAMKPSIPSYGADGIPIRDELELVLEPR